MASTSIEASSSGVKLSYLRFISDSAPGFAVLMLLGFVLKDHPLASWARKKEFKVLFAALSFFLATPVGLLINAVSYFLLGHIQTQINRICFLSRGWPVRDTRRSLLLEETIKHFTFTTNDWAERTDVYEELVESYRPDLTFRIEHLRGPKRFARSVALLAFVCFVLAKPRFGMAIVGLTLIAQWLFWFYKVRSSETPGAAKHHSMWIVIVLVITALLVSARVMDLTWLQPRIDPPLAFMALAIAPFALLVAGTVEFYQRATIAMYIHVECPAAGQNDWAGIRRALWESAQRLRA